MAKLLAFHLVIVLLFTTSSYADPNVNIAASTALTLVDETFLIQCNVADFVPAVTGTYYVHINIRYDHDLSTEIVYDSYAIRGRTNNQPEITRFTPKSDSNATVAPGNYNLNSYQFKVSPKKTGLKEIRCILEYLSDKTENNFNLFSPTTNVSTFSILPPAVLSTSVKKLQVGQSFTATCTIRDFTVAKEHYQIQLYNQRDGLLGSYEVKASSAIPPLLTHENYPNTSIHDGQVIAFPRFDFEVQEAVDSNQIYWCALEDLVTGLMAISWKWSNGPLMNFISTKISATERKGSCQIGNVNLNEKEYSVSFYGKLNVGGENLLAKYSVKINQRVELETEHVPHWMRITAGEHASYPYFDVLTTMDGSFDGEWWCMVEVGVNGEMGYQKYKSNRVAL